MAAFLLHNYGSTLLLIIRTTTELTSFVFFSTRNVFLNTFIKKRDEASREYQLQYQASVDDVKLLYSF